MCGDVDHPLVDLIFVGAKPRAKPTSKAADKSVRPTLAKKELVGFAELTVGEIAEHDRVGGALHVLLLLGFGGARCGILAQALAEFLAHFAAAGHDLHVEPEEVAHLVERGFQDVKRFHLSWVGEGFHQFRVVGRLHGGAVEFALDSAQVFGYAQDAEMNIVHAGAVVAVHVVLSSVANVLSPFDSLCSLRAGSAGPVR